MLIYQKLKQNEKWGNFIVVASCMIENVLQEDFAKKF